VNEVADGPCSDQGETHAKPRPAPKVTRTSESDTATTAPARIAPHEAAEFDLSRVDSSIAGGAGGVPIMMTPASDVNTWPAAE